MERGRAYIVASLDEVRPDGDIAGEVTVHNHDITDLLLRLGVTKVWRVPKWAATPRIVPPNDVQLLRYHLGLALDNDSGIEAKPNAPIPVVHGTPLNQPRAPAPQDPKLVELEARLKELEGWLAQYRSEKAEAAAAAAADKAAAETAFGLSPETRTKRAADKAFAEGPTELATPAPDPGERPEVSPRTAPHPGLTREATVHATLADALRAAVFASPASDAARREYAAHLHDLGDERGELIALQLGRVERGEPISDRERALVEKVGDACAQPLRWYFTSFEIRRGFVWKAQMERGVTVSETVRADPAWATIEDLATTDTNLLATAQLTSLKSARIDQRTFEQLGRSDGLISIDTLLPYPEPGSAPTRGIALEPIDGVRWLDVIDGGAFVTHSLCVDGAKLAGRVPQFLHSRLVRRLSHLDAWIDPATAPAWREAFDTLELPLLTLRFATLGIEPVIGFERRDGSHRLVVELRATVSAEIAADLAKLIITLGAGISELDLVDTSLAPFPAQQPDLTRALAHAFSTIELRRGDSLALV